MMSKLMRSRIVQVVCLSALLISSGCIRQSDRQFLESLMRDTWACLDAMIDAATGLPRDTQQPGGHTNTTNIGLYLASLCTAREIGLVDDEYGLSRAEKIIGSLETFERVSGFMPNFIEADLSKRSSHGTMAVSDFNKLAVGLIMTRQTWPQLSERIDAFLEEIEWSRLYNDQTGKLSWGYDLDNDAPVGSANLWLTADTRAAVFMMIATEAAPPAVWDRMERHPKETSAGLILRGYGMGGLFLHAMDGLFLPEVDTEVGESAGNFAWHQIKMAERKGFPLWGWSNCYIPGKGYTEGGYIPERVVTPNAVALMAEYYPRHVASALREMVRRGGAVPPEGYEGKKWGLRDAYDMKNDLWDDRYLSLDQGMVFLGLANYLYDGIVRRIYIGDPLVQHGLKLLEPHIEHDAGLLERWKERDRQSISPVGEFPAPGSEETVVSISLDKPGTDLPEDIVDIDQQDGAVLVTLNTKGRDGLHNVWVDFPAIDLSRLDRLEIDMEVLSSSNLPVGAPRIYVEDRFGQQRYAHFRADPEVSTYVISADDLYGIFLDEAAVQRIVFSFWKSPWYYKDWRMETDACKFKLNAVRFVSR